MKSRSEILKDRYGFNKAGYKYIPRGSEILKSIGQTVILVEHTRDDQGKWDAKFKTVILVSISDFDPVTGTYLTKYREKSEDGNTDEDKEFRMIPEGYSFGNPEETGEMKRFLPYSLHCQLVEDEIFYSRLAQLYKERDTLTTEQLYGLATSKDKNSTLKYFRHLAVVIKLGDDDPSTQNILYFRLHGLGLKHRNGKNYALSVEDGQDNKYRQMIDTEMTEYPFEDVGTFKIIDLAS